MTDITLRSTKGSPLTNNECDANFENLNTHKVEVDSATGAAHLPSGTTAQRPASPSPGYVRFNTDLGHQETWTGSTWEYADPAGTSLALSIALG